MRGNRDYIENLYNSQFFCEQKTALKIYPMDLDNSVVKTKRDGGTGEWRWANGERGDTCNNGNI